MSDFLHNEGKKFGAEHMMRKIKDIPAQLAVECLFRYCLELEERIEKLEKGK